MTPNQFNRAVPELEQEIAAHFTPEQQKALAKLFNLATEWAGLATDVPLAKLPEEGVSGKPAKEHWHRGDRQLINVIGPPGGDCWWCKNGYALEEGSCAS